jgi:hypothetical protein
MTHHQPKWRASGGVALSPAHPFTAPGGFFLAQDIAVPGAPRDKIDSVLATTLREGGGMLWHSTEKNCGITRHRRAQSS